MAKYSSIKYGNNGTYGIRSRVFQFGIYKWNLLGAVLKLLTLKWNLLGKIFQLLTFRWNLITNVIKIFSSLWNLLGGLDLWAKRGGNSSGGWNGRSENP